MPLYTEEEIHERVEGLISIMFEQPVNDIEYQSYVFKIILYELFHNANERFDEWKMSLVML